jgi:hypothetical protein
LTNGFSEKIGNYAAAVAPGCFAFIKIHWTLRSSPFMAEGVSRLTELVKFLDTILEKTCHVSEIILQVHVVAGCGWV